MKFNLKEKIKNYGFWTSLGAAIIMFVQNLGNIFGFNVNSAVIESIITGVCGILVVLGIVNNPKEGSWYADATINSVEAVKNEIETNDAITKK